MPKTISTKTDRVFIEQLNISLEVVSEDETIVQINYIKPDKTHNSSDNLLINQLKAQIGLFSSNPCLRIDVPHKLKGTEFQKKVWHFLHQIPAGEVMSYGQLSQIVGGSPLAVGQALKRNPLPLIYPCHRVVAKSGIGGFAGARDGYLVDLKKTLLKLESSCK
jgi:methylated-DNA-[protein]-cysteine S-methyltransferase